MPAAVQGFVRRLTEEARPKHRAAVRKVVGLQPKAPLGIKVFSPGERSHTTTAKALGVAVPQSIFANLAVQKYLTGDARCGSL
jgi:hypothetical protein